MRSEICKKCADKSCYGYDHRITECEDFQPMINYDRIVSKSPEELAKIFVCKCCPSVFFSNFTPEENPCNKYSADDCFKCWLNWLKSPSFPHAITVRELVDEDSNELYE